MTVPIPRREWTVPAAAGRREALKLIDCHYCARPTRRPRCLARGKVKNSSASFRTDQMKCRRQWIIGLQATRIRSIESAPKIRTTNCTKPFAMCGNYPRLMISKPKSRNAVQDYLLGRYILRCVPAFRTGPAYAGLCDECVRPRTARAVDHLRKDRPTALYVLSAGAPLRQAAGNRMPIRAGDDHRFGADRPFPRAGPRRTRVDRYAGQARRTAQLTFDPFTRCVHTAEFTRLPHFCRSEISYQRLCHFGRRVGLEVGGGAELRTDLIFPVVLMVEACDGSKIWV